MEEIRLKQLIREVVREEMGGYILTEMAMSLSDYKKLIDNLITQIAQNWCLVRYATITGEKEILKRHWQSELKAHLTNISRRTLKKGNNVQTKEKALYAVWNENDFDTNEHCIDMAIADKFRDEEIDIYSKTYADVVSDFKNATKEIINVILSDSHSTINKYVLSI